MCAIALECNNTSAGIAQRVEQNDPTLTTLDWSVAGLLPVTAHITIDIYIGASFEGGQLSHGVFTRSWRFHRSDQTEHSADDVQVRTICARAAKRVECGG